MRSIGDHEIAVAFLASFHPVQQPVEVTVTLIHEFLPRLVNFLNYGIKIHYPLPDLHRS